MSKLKNENGYKLCEVCEILNISTYTLANWYRWEKRQLEDGIVKEKYLPEPKRLIHEKGQPRVWSEEDVKKLLEHQKNIITGRNGIFGEYSNPYYKNTEKYKKSVEKLEK